MLTMPNIFFMLYMESRYLHNILVSTLMHLENCNTESKHQMSHRHKQFSFRSAFFIAMLSRGTESILD